MIELDAVTKQFRRRHGESIPALRDVSWYCPPGRICGLLGANGAGKSTLLRLLVTLLQPSAGTVRVCGFNAALQAPEIRRRVGYLACGTGLPERLTGRELLHFQGACFGLRRAAAAERVEHLAGALRCTGCLDRPLGTLSTGNRQRIAIARALIHGPDLVILDEPTTGLDVMASAALHGLVLLQREEGRSVILATHDMVAARHLCDELLILADGRIAAQGRPDSILAGLGAERLDEAVLRICGAGGHARGAPKMASP